MCVCVGDCDVVVVSFLLYIDWYRVLWVLIGSCVDRGSPVWDGRRAEFFYRVFTEFFTEFLPSFYRVFRLAQGLAPTPTDPIRLDPILPSFTEFYRVEKFTRFYQVLLGFTGFYLVLLSFTWFYLVLLGFTGFYQVLLGFTGFCRVLLDFTGF